MAIEVRPATDFDDVRTMVGPKRPDANVCWCLSYRIPSKENRVLIGPAGLALLLAGMCGIARADERIPEIDAGTMSSALSLLFGGLLILSGRRRKI